MKLLNQAQDVQIKPTPTPTMTPTYNPTISPTRVPTPAPTTKEHMLRQILKEYLDPHEHFAGTKAWYWLVETDTVFTAERDEYEYVERYVAAHIYFQLNGKNWKINPNFIDGSTHHCQWHRKETHDKDFLGIRCDNESNTVTHLDLAENKVSGSIPSELAAFSGLISLNLYQNEIHENIPKEIGSLSNLQEIELGHNGLVGNLPTEIGQLVELSILNIPWNQLQGSIPTEVAELIALTRLSFAWNQLTGQIPILPSGLLDCWLYKNQFSETSNAALLGCHI